MPEAVRSPGETAPERAGTPDGSLRYYAVLFAAPATRALLHACYALEASLRETALSANHDIAHTRLQWWREELALLAGGQARHPVTRILAQAVPRAERVLLRELVVAAEFDLARCTYDDWDELDAYCMRAGGALQEVIAAGVLARGSVTLEERTFARRLGAAIRKAEMLRDFSADLRQGWLYLPTSALTEAGLDPRAVQSRPDHPALPRLLSEWQGRLAAELAALPGLLDATQRRRQTQGLVLAALHRRLLVELGTRAASGKRVGLAPLAPIARLWVAWRAAVASQRTGTRLAPRPTQVPPG